MGIEPAVFRQVMSRFLSGVTVVTTAWNGELYGITVSSFSSLSLEPTLVLISIDKKSRSHEAIMHAGQFVVNILAEEQQELSARFASRDEGQKFVGTSYHTGTLGLPILDNVLAYAECRLFDQLPGGDHTIFVGEMLAGNARDGQPLGYFGGSYQQLAR